MKKCPQCGHRQPHFNHPIVDGMVRWGMFQCEKCKGIWR